MAVWISEKITALPLAPPGVLANRKFFRSTYALNQKPYLAAFLSHGEADISNNFAENAIRPFVVGRKNWLFSETAKGAESSAIVYTLVETAKANGLNPHAYLLLLLEKLPYLGHNPSQNNLDIFMP